MAKLPEYTVEINGRPITMRLNEDDAKRMNAKPVSKAKTPANKSATAQNK